MSKSMKRTATTELNSDNWDQDDEPEEAGTFKAIGQEELSKRVIKVAKRRLQKPNDEQRPLFSSFSGFGKANTVPDVKNTFSFLSNVNGSHAQNNTSVPVASEKKNEEEKPAVENEYLTNIKTLNGCLIDWIQQCVKKNPSCVLTPIFKDYEKHFDSLKPSSEKTEETKSNEVVSNFKFNFASSTNKTQNSTPDSSSLQSDNKFNNVISSSATNPTTSSWLSSSTISKTNVFSNLSSNSTNLKPAPMFNFLSNSNTIKMETVAENSESKEGDGDEDAPPVNDFKPVTEDDALFSQRVKVFVKNDKQYADRGVGTLYIKEVDDGKGSKIHQVIVRADTSLGNILLNFRITSDIPTKRVGKNNVMVACLAPEDSKKEKKDDSKPKPVPFLLRVKTEEDADKLLAEINKYK